MTHEVKPITSGYRLVLVYNLVHESHVSFPSATLAVGKRNALEIVLRSWHEASKEDECEVPKSLVYSLDYQYTDASLSLQALKGEDRVKAEYLRETCADAGICFYLASMEHMKHGSAEENNYDNYYGHNGEDQSAHHHDIEDVMEESLSLKRVVDLHGHLLARNLALDEETFIEEDPFDGREPDREDYEGYTGNAGASATHWYHVTVREKSAIV